MKKLVNWNDSLACGISIIDNQHKCLVQLLNKLYEHSQSQEDISEVFGKALRFMAAYAQKHFASEIILMQCINFPEVKEHDITHQRFVLKVVDTVQAYNNASAGKKTQMMKEIVFFLKGWIEEHVSIVDAKYALCVNELKRTGKLTEQDIRQITLKIDEFLKQGQSQK